MKAKFAWLFSLACVVHLCTMASGQPGGTWDPPPTFPDRAMIGKMGEIANGVKLSVDPENDLETGKLIAEMEEIPPLHALNFKNFALAKGSILDNDVGKARYVANPKKVLRQLLLDGKYPEVTKGKIVAGDAVELDVLDNLSMKDSRFERKHVPKKITLGERITKNLDKLMGDYIMGDYVGSGTSPVLRPDRM